MQLHGNRFTIWRILAVLYCTVLDTSVRRTLRVCACNFLSCTVFDPLNKADIKLVLAVLSQSWGDTNRLNCKYPGESHTIYCNVVETSLKRTPRVCPCYPLVIFLDPIQGRTSVPSNRYLEVTLFHFQSSYFTSHKTDTSLKRIPRVCPCYPLVIFLDPIQGRTSVPSNRYLEVTLFHFQSSYFTSHKTDTSLKRIPRVGVCCSSVIFLDFL